MNYTDQKLSQNQRISTLRSTVKVNQIEPPESDIENYSHDSKEKDSSPLHASKSQNRIAKAAKSNNNNGVNAKNLPLKIIKLKVAPLQDGGA